MSRFAESSEIPKITPRITRINRSANGTATTNSNTTTSLISEPVAEFVVNASKKPNLEPIDSMDGGAVMNTTQIETLTKPSRFETDTATKPSRFETDTAVSVVTKPSRFDTAPAVSVVTKPSRFDTDSATTVTTMSTVSAVSPAAKPSRFDPAPSVTKPSRFDPAPAAKPSRFDTVPAAKPSRFDPAPAAKPSRFDPAPVTTAASEYDNDIDDSDDENGDLKYDDDLIFEITTFPQLVRDKNWNGIEKKYEGENYINSSVDDIIIDIDVYPSAIKTTDVSQKQVRTEYNADIYQTIDDQRLKVIKTPGMYIGGTVPIKFPTEIFIQDYENKNEEGKVTSVGKIVPYELTIPDALVRFLHEIASNVSDNADASRRIGVPFGEMEFKMNKLWCSMKSTGKPFYIGPIDNINYCNKHTFRSTMQNMFGIVGSSSNFDDGIVRTGAGVNGIGSKAVNIFSIRVIVTVADGVTGVFQRIEWRSNMADIVSNEIYPKFIYVGNDDEPFDHKKWIPNPKEKKYVGESYVKFEWLADFDYFNYPSGYTAEDFCLFQKILIDYGKNAGMIVSFNGVKYDYRNIKDYAALYFEKSLLKQSLIHYEWGGNYQGECTDEEVINLIKSKDQKDINALHKLVSKARIIEHMPSTEILVVSTPTRGKFVSFCNGVPTTKGGAHVDEAYEKFGRPILNAINSGALLSKKKTKKDDNKKTIELLRQKKKRGKRSNVINADDEENKKKDKEKNKKIKLNITSIKHNLTIVIIHRCFQPSFVGQSKERMITPEPTFQVTPEEIQKMSTWNFNKTLMNESAIKAHKDVMGNMEGKKYLAGKGRPAKYCAHKNLDLRRQTTLMIMEGKSAEAYLKERLKRFKNGVGHNFYGTLPIQGKLLNVEKYSDEVMLKNREILNIIKTLNLNFGLDYGLKENLDTLSYGRVMFVVDADDDGAHIQGLLLNFFNSKFPTLVKQGYFSVLRTPIIKAVQREKIIARFYTEKEYEEWKALNTNVRCKFNYYKGLGSSNSKDVTDDFETAPIVGWVFDENAAKLFKLIFTNKYMKNKKSWIFDLKNREEERVVKITDSGKGFVRNISNIFVTDFFSFILTAFKRAIPSYKDGFKKSQRQAVWTQLLKENFGKDSNRKSISVDRVACGIAEKTHYHHGAKSMEETVISMAQTFVGANNLPLFLDDGQFGTRDDLGNDHSSPRYIKTKLTGVVQYIFKKELLNLIEHNIEDGDEKVEAKELPSVIPMHLVNGQVGMSVGFSTTILPHNPRDLIQCTRNKLDDLPLPALKPFFLGFKGTCVIADPKKDVVKEIIKEKSGKTIATIRAKTVVDNPFERQPRVKDPEIIAALEKSEGKTLEDMYNNPNEEEEEEENDLDEENEDKTSSESEDESRDIEDYNGFISSDVRNIYEMRKNQKGYKLIVYGVFKIVKEKKYDDNLRSYDINITELPVGTNIGKYILKLNKMEIEGVIDDWYDYSEKVNELENISFVIKGFKSPGEPDYKSLGLVKSYGLTNQTLIDDDGYPIRYNNSKEIFEAYYDNMYGIYDKYIKSNIKAIEDKINKIRDIIKFLELYYDKTSVDFRDLNDDEQDQLYALHGINRDNLEGITGNKITKNNINKYKDDLEKEIEKYENAKQYTVKILWNQDLDDLENYLDRIKYPHSTKSRF